MSAMAGRAACSWRRCRREGGVRRGQAGKANAAASGDERGAKTERARRREVYAGRMSMHCLVLPRTVAPAQHSAFPFARLPATPLDSELRSLRRLRRYSRALLSMKTRDQTCLHATLLLLGPRQPFRTLGALIQNAAHRPRRSFICRTRSRRTTTLLQANPRGRGCQQLLAIGEDKYLSVVSNEAGQPASCKPPRPFTRSGSRIPARRDRFDCFLGHIPTLLLQALPGSRFPRRASVSEDAARTVV